MELRGLYRVVCAFSPIYCIRGFNRSDSGYSQLGGDDVNEEMLELKRKLIERKNELAAKVDTLTAHEVRIGAIARHNEILRIINMIDGGR